MASLAGLYNDLHLEGITLQAKKPSSHEVLDSLSPVLLSPNAWLTAGNFFQLVEVSIPLPGIGV